MVLFVYFVLGFLKTKPVNTSVCISSGYHTHRSIFGVNAENLEGPALKHGMCTYVRMCERGAEAERAKMAAFQRVEHLEKVIKVQFLKDIVANVSVAGRSKALYIFVHTFC